MGSAQGPCVCEMDAQVFGVFAPFPIVFVCASLASALDILLVLQLTLKSLPVALSSFLVANVTAALVGSREGPRWESWYSSRKRMSDAPPGSMSSSSTTPMKRVVSKSLKARVFDDDEESTLLGGRNDSPSEASGDLPPRNRKFYGALIAVAIFANLLGMMWGSWCSQNFPSRLK